MSYLICIQERKQLALKRKKKQRERELQFQEIRDHYVLTEENEEIVAFSFSELRQKLQNRDLTCEQVLKAFIAKSIVVQDEFNCITEFVQNARVCQYCQYDMLVDLIGWISIVKNNYFNFQKKAKELDQMGQTKGPLHGIPFCVKDDTNVEGMDSTCGFSALLYKPAVKSAVIVQVLESLGAIAFCRTNVPQSCLSIASENPIFGQTLNPLNKKLGPGGSSSGWILFAYIFYLSEEFISLICKHQGPLVLWQLVVVTLELEQIAEDHFEFQHIVVDFRL